jgi:hypothetical protein
MEKGDTGQPSKIKAIIVRKVQGGKWSARMVSYLNLGGMC